MTYTALAVAFVLICVGLGSTGKVVVGNPRLAAGLAAVMVLAQFAFLVWR
jgi:hypothetical protein